MTDTLWKNWITLRFSRLLLTNDSKTEGERAHVGKEKRERESDKERGSERKSASGSIAIKQNFTHVYHSMVLINVSQGGSDMNSFYVCYCMKTRDNEKERIWNGQTENLINTVWHFVKCFKRSVDLSQMNQITFEHRIKTCF